MKNPNNIDAYIAGFESEIQDMLEQIRLAIRNAAPDASEIINYGIPTFTLNGNLVHFAAFSKHIGFYPAPSAIIKFSKELSKYKSAKGSVQFPLDEPLPLELVNRMVAFRVKENLAKKPVKSARKNQQK